MTARVLRLLQEARQDLLVGKTFYEQLQPGIGAYFWDSLLADVESLQIYAGIHRRHFDFYRMLAKRFPYAVYYDLNETHITIVAIFPLRRSPAWLADQFRERLSES
jgi:hypothetical protein